MPGGEALPLLASLDFVMDGHKALCAEHRASATGNPRRMCPLARRLRLLPGGRFYNRYLGRHLLAFFHASHDDQATVRNQQAAMIHGGLGSVFADRFPLAGVDVKSESHRGRFGGPAVIADSAVVVGIVGSAGEIDSACFFSNGPAPAAM